MIQGKREESMLKKRREGMEAAETEAVVPEVVLQV